MEAKRKILVVDDEADLCEIVKFNLEMEGYEVSTAGSAEEALAMGVTAFDLLLLDVMMGGMSGFAMARRLKEAPETCGIPIIFLTAKDTENDTVTGFNLGADDYISKPFSLRELVARVKAVLRRTGETMAAEETETVGYERLVMHLKDKSVTVDGQEVAFTRTEFDLLKMLIANSGRVFSRQELIDRVWPQDVMVLDRTVDVNIARLRKKIGPYADCIVTRLGFGYSFNKKH